MTTEEENRLKVMAGDIGNTYLNNDTKNNIYTHTGPEFELLGIMSDGNFLK